VVADEGEDVMTKKLITPPGVRSSDGSTRVDLSGLPLPKRVEFLMQRMQRFEHLMPRLLELERRVDVLECLGRLVHLVVPLVEALERAGLTEADGYMAAVEASRGSATKDPMTCRALALLRTLADPAPPVAPTVEYQTSAQDLANKLAGDPGVAVVRVDEATGSAEVVAPDHATVDRQAEDAIALGRRVLAAVGSARGGDRCTGRIASGAQCGFDAPCSIHPGGA
jgi:hypothetical protein